MRKYLTTENKVELIGQTLGKFKQTTKFTVQIDVPSLLCPYNGAMNIMH